MRQTAHLTRLRSVLRVLAGPLVVTEQDHAAISRVCSRPPDSLDPIAVENRSLDSRLA